MGEMMTNIVSMPSNLLAGLFGDETPRGPPSPPAEPPYPPLIVCPPSTPPPGEPPMFHTYMVPFWMWCLLFLMFVMSCAGAFAMHSLYRELKEQRRGIRLPGSETGGTLRDLERRVAARAGTGF